MSRFLWLMRREVWEHRAIWIAPSIILMLLLFAVLTGNVHLGPIGNADVGTVLGMLPADKQAKMLLVVYAALALVVHLVMGIIAFFYALDSLYADRRDRSALFWKSLPISDAETVLSKFAVAALVIPAFALVAALLAQLLVAAGGSAQLAMAGGDASIMWQPGPLFGAAGITVLWIATELLWGAPILAYLMLASAWAPKGPVLWAILPPVALVVLERILMRTDTVGDFIAHRMFGVYELLQSQEKRIDATLEMDDKTVTVDHGGVFNGVDLRDALVDFYALPDLWLGLVAAALLLGGAIWLRRYRDENA